MNAIVWLAFAGLIVACALANRFSGGGLGWEKLKHDAGGPLHGHPVFYAGLALIAVGAGLGAPQTPSLAFPWALLGLGFAVGRSIVLGKDWATPDTLGEILLAFLQHAIVAAFGWAVGTWFDLPRMGMAVLVWAIASTLLAVWYASRERKAVKHGHGIDPGDNTFVEYAQGALYGVALAVGSFGVLQPAMFAAG